MKFLTLMVAMFWLPTTHAQDSEQQIHSEWVLIALDYDFYNHRCRGMSVDQNFNKVKRLFITKYGISPNNYIEAFLADPNQDFFAFKEQKEREFMRQLAQKGGCQSEQARAWLKQMKKDFSQHQRQVEDSNWFPIIDRVNITQVLGKA